MNRQMSEKVDKALEFLDQYDGAREMAERELKEILPLFPNGDEQYLIISLRFDGINENLYSRTGGFDDFVSFLYNFQQWEGEDDGFNENFSFLAVKNDQEVYRYDSDCES